jgi:hypothetical protein
MNDPDVGAENALHIHSEEAGRLAVQGHAIQKELLDPSTKNCYKPTLQHYRDKAYGLTPYHTSKAYLAALHHEPVSNEPVLDNLSPSEALVQRRIRAAQLRSEADKHGANAKRLLDGVPEMDNSVDAAACVREAATEWAKGQRCREGADGHEQKAAKTTDAAETMMAMSTGKRILPAPEGSSDGRGWE